MSMFTSTQGEMPRSGARKLQRMAVTWVLPSGAASVRSARQQIGSQLSAWGLRHLVDDAQLIVSELVTNAVCHGPGDGPVWHTARRIRASTGEAVRIEVGDYGPGFRVVPAPPQSDGDMPCSGRGLGLVDVLASTWGAWRLPHGHLVWAVLPVGAG